MRERHLQIPTGPKTEKKGLSTTTVVLATCLALLVVLTGTAVARYQHQLGSDGAVRAKEFYFTSDLLDGGVHPLAPGTKEVSFTLRNHADDLRFSEMDIAYEVTVGDGQDTSVTVEYSEAERKLEKGKASDATITLSGLESGKTYLVNAIGKGGYTETLTATIKVDSEAPSLHQHQETSSGEYTLLTVWNEGDEPGKVTIEYAGIPDNTNPNMQDWQTGPSSGTRQTKEVAIAPHESKVFRFFGPATITVLDSESNELKSQLPQ